MTFRARETEYQSRISIFVIFVNIIYDARAKVLKENTAKLAFRGVESVKGHDTSTTGDKKIEKAILAGEDLAFAKIYETKRKVD